MSEGAGPSALERARRPVALLVVGLVFAFLPGLVAGEYFLATEIVKNRVNPQKYMSTDMYWATRDVTVPSLLELVRYEAGWAVAMGTLLGAPLLFVWWRRSAAAIARATGVLCCATASVAVCVLALSHPLHKILDRSWIWWTVPLGGALMAAAFLVAPTPRPRDEG